MEIIEYARRNPVHKMIKRRIDRETHIEGANANIWCRTMFNIVTLAEEINIKPENNLRCSVQSLTAYFEDDTTITCDKDACYRFFTMIDLAYISLLARGYRYDFPMWITEGG